MHKVTIRRREKKGNHIVAAAVKKNKYQKEDKLENTILKAFQLFHQYRNIFSALSSSAFSCKDFFF